MLQNEILERDKFIVEKLRNGDSQWTDGEMRARLNELEYILQTPTAIIMELELLQQKKDIKGE